MRNKDISGILSLPPKERINILAEEIARRMYNTTKPTLSQGDKDALIGSFKSMGEVRLYNKWRRYSEVTFHALNILMGQYNVVMKNYSDLRGYMLVYNGMETAEHLANRILSEIKDPGERRRIATKGAREVKFFYSEIQADREGYLRIKPDPPVFIVQKQNGKQEGFTDESQKQAKFTLRILINNVKVEAQQSVIKYLSWRQAVVEYLDRSEFKTETLRGLVDDMTKDVHSDIMDWSKYLERYESFTKGEPGGRIDTLKDIYIITPDTSSLQIDQDLYGRFKALFL